MEPEEIDKLFNERLGRMAPTPPADLWNRLQERMQDEMPAAAPVLQAEPEHQEKRHFGFLYYSIAAAITLLLAVGVVLKYNQPQTITEQTIAQVDITKQADQPAAQTTQPEATPEQSIAAVAPEVTAEPTITSEPAIVADATEPVKKHTAPKAKAKAAARWVKVEPAQQPAAMLAQQTTKPATPEAQAQPGATMHTPASFASASSAEPVEIIIKRAIDQEETVAIASAEEPAQESSFERKQRLAKNIFKQVKNLSNGEKIDLHDMGLNADRIALETKIGKQKISKVINL